MKFLEYFLNTNIHEDHILSESICKNKRNIQSSLGIWQDKYGVVKIGSDNNKMLVLSGKIVCKTQLECDGILSSLKVELKELLPNCKKIAEEYVAKGDII